jgi:3-oxoacyl-[acyl-carrier protein] reductase
MSSYRKENLMGLENRSVVITGATGGLGRVAAHTLAENGANLVLVSANPVKLAGLAQELKLPPERWLAVPADLTTPAAAPKVTQATLDKFGRVDVLLHFVGGWMGGAPAHQAPADEVSAMLDQHLWTPFYMVQALVPHMLSNGFGRLVVVSSPVVALPPANTVAYTVAKSAQEALLLTLAEELKGSPVTANILRVRTIDVKHERDSLPTPKNVSWTTPEEISGAIVYLCSAEAHTVNGARIPLYGSA